MLPGAQKDSQQITEDWQKLSGTIRASRCAGAPCRAPQGHHRDIPAQWDPTGLPVVHAYQSRLCPAPLAPGLSSAIDRPPVREPGSCKGCPLRRPRAAGPRAVSWNCLPAMQTLPRGGAARDLAWPAMSRQCRALVLNFPTGHKYRIGCCRLPTTSEIPICGKWATRRNQEWRRVAVRCFDRPRLRAARGAWISGPTRQFAPDVDDIEETQKRHRPGAAAGIRSEPGSVCETRTARTLRGYAGDRRTQRVRKCKRHESGGFEPDRRSSAIACS